MGAILTQPQGAVGNILGPGAWSDNALIRADGDNSNKVQGSPIICTDGGAVTGMASLEITGLTASRLVGTSAGKLLQSEDLVSWVAGTANQIAVADDADGSITLSTPQDIATGSSPTFVGLTLSGLTASRLVATSGGSALASVADLTAWVAGTTNRVTVTDDTDGTITLSGPQDIHTGASPTFVDLTLTGNLDIPTTSSTAGQITQNGGTRILHTYGTDNIFLGSGASNFTLSGANYNVGIGSLSLDALTSGDANMCMGFMTGSALTSGSNNVLLGENTGRSLTTTSNNTLVGSRSMWSAGGGIANTSLGTLTMPTAGGVVFNLAVGYQALYTLSTGNFNTAIGATAGWTLSTGSSNVFLGYQAGYYETSSNKLFIDNATRANEADGRVKALIYGVFDAATANQLVRINGALEVREDATMLSNIIMPEDGWIGITGPAERIVFDGTGGIVRVADADLEIATAAPTLIFNDSDGDNYSIVADAGVLTASNTTGGAGAARMRVDGHIGIGNSAPTAGHILIGSESYATTGTVIGFGCFPEYAPTSAATANTISSIQGNTWFSTANWGAGSRVQCLDFYPAPLIAGTAFGSANLDISAINTAGLLNILGRTITANTVTGISVAPLTNIFGGTDDTTANVVRGIYVSSAAATTGTWGRLTGIEVEPQTSGVINQGIWLAGDGVGADLVFGAGQDARMHYDGTDMYLVTDLVAASDFILDCGTEKTLELAEVVWNDINFGAGQGQLPTASIPGTVTFTDNGGGDTGIATVGFAVGEKLSFTTEYLHDVKEGTDLYFHVHFQTDDAPTGTDYVKFQIEYTITRDGTTCAAVTTISKEVAVDTQYEQIRADFDLVSGTGLQIGDQIKCTLSRVASTGDAYAGEAKLVTFGIHVQLDTVGSRQRFVK